MRKYFLGLVYMVLLVPAFSGSAAAAGYYVGILGGVGFLPEAEATDAGGQMNFSYDTGYDGSITFGFDLGEEYPKIGHGRVEIEFNKAKNDYDEVEFVEGKVRADGSVARTSIMLNTIGEYKTESGVIIYALLGLGWARISLDNVTIMGDPFVNDSDDQLAYQAGVGLTWQFSRHFFFDVSYRYYGTTDPKFTEQDGAGLDYKYSSNRVLAGFRLQF